MKKLFDPERPAVGETGVGEGGRVVSSRTLMNLV